MLNEEWYSSWNVINGINLLSIKNRGEQNFPSGTCPQKEPLNIPANCSVDGPVRHFIHPCSLFLCQLSKGLRRTSHLIRGWKGPIQALSIWSGTMEIAHLFFMQVPLTQRSDVKRRANWCWLALRRSCGIHIISKSVHIRPFKHGSRKHNDTVSGFACPLRKVRGNGPLIEFFLHTSQEPYSTVLLPTATDFYGIE